MTLHNKNVTVSKFSLVQIKNKQKNSEYSTHIIL